MPLLLPSLICQYFAKGFYVFVREGHWFLFSFLSCPHQVLVSLLCWSQKTIWEVSLPLLFSKSLCRIAIISSLNV